MADLKRSKFLKEVSIEINGEEYLAIYQTMSRGLAVFTMADWCLAVARGETEPGVLDMLLEQGILVRSNVDETRVFEAWRQQYVQDQSSLKSKILATRRCNNGCRYCIVDAEARDMSSETAKEVDDFYLKCIQERNPRVVEDAYSGGEVLLNSRVVLESATRRFYFCLGRGIDYGFSIISNGVLITPSIVAGMQNVGLKGIRVSLAGPAPIHDRLRPSRTNEKTYDRIVENLRSISGMLPIGIECNYDAGSEDFLRIPEMMDDLLGKGVDVNSMTFTPIMLKRGDFAFRSGMGDPAKLLFLMHEAEKRGWPQFHEPPSNACLADFRSCMTFDTDGSIIPCSSLQGGEMTYGSAKKGIDFVAHSQILSRRFPEKCTKECALLPVCMGGCRLQPLATAGDFHGVDCHYEIFDLILEEYIRRTAIESLAQKDGSLEAQKAA